jgi:uncharacterized SAM-binding protein YcdF (DUF218 family)
METQEKKEVKSVVEMTEYIFLRDNLALADLIFVFGTRYKESAEKAAEVYRAGYAPRVLISGGVNKISKLVEADELKKVLEVGGVPAAAIFSERESTNTLANVQNSAKMIATEIGWDKIKKIIVVAKNYHIRRALMTLKKHFPENIQYFISTYSIEGINRDDWMKDDNGYDLIYGEDEKIEKYYALGHLARLED